MRHQAGDVAGARSSTPAIARSEPFGLAGSSGRGRRARRVDVAEQDLAVALERVERRVVGVVAALAVGDRHAQRPPLAERVGERRVEPLGRDRAPRGPANRSDAVAQQRARHEPGLGEDLEAVADARARGRRRAANAATARMTGLNRAMTPGPQVVAVGEAAGQDDRGDAVERRLLVPQDDRLGAGELEARGPCRGRSCEPGKTTTPMRTAHQRRPGRRPTTRPRSARPRTPR